MRVLAHCSLGCFKKECNGKNYPLKLNIKEKETTETDVNPQFLKNILTKIPYSALVEVDKAINQSSTIPEQLPEGFEENDDVLKLIHNLLMDTHIIEGELNCPNCDRAYAVTDGIANMLPLEDEV